MHFVLGVLTVVTSKQRNPSAQRNGVRDINFCQTHPHIFRFVAAHSPTSPPRSPTWALSSFTWARWLHVFPLLLINLASWQTVCCDTSVGGTGNWHDGSLICPAGDTWGRYHRDRTCCPTSLWMCFAVGNSDSFSVSSTFIHLLCWMSDFRVQTASDDSN